MRVSISVVPTGGYPYFGNPHMCVYIYMYRYILPTKLTSLPSTSKKGQRTVAIHLATFWAHLAWSCRLKPRNPNAARMQRKCCGFRDSWEFTDIGFMKIA